jgi:hypothetical protein
MQARYGTALQMEPQLPVTVATSTQRLRTGENLKGPGGDCKCHGTISGVGPGRARPGGRVTGPGRGRRALRLGVATECTIMPVPTVSSALSELHGGVSSEFAAPGPLASILHHPQHGPATRPAGDSDPQAQLGRHPIPTGAARSVRCRTAAFTEVFAY